MSSFRTKGVVLLRGIRASAFILLVLSGTSAFAAGSGKSVLMGHFIYQAPPSSEANQKIQLQNTSDPKSIPALTHPERTFNRFEDRLLELGAGDERFETLERGLIKDQVKSFIPPLLVPAVGGHAFVLPPGLFQTAIGFKFANVSGDDFFKNGEVNPVDADKGTDRRFMNFTLRYGFDLDEKFLHSFTVVLNVPYLSSVSTGDVIFPNQPGGGGSLPGRYVVNNGGTAEGIGDISLFVKKKLLDQGNYPIGLAVAGGVYFPTGSNSEKAGDNGRITVDGPTFTSNPTFKRFSDDGRFPTVLQPGTGTFSYQAGIFLTRQFLPGDMPSFLAGTPFDRAAIHMGAVHRFNSKADGIDPGDRSTFFFSAVLPMYKDYISLQATSLTFYQQEDSYDGTFRFPGTPAAVPRPSFSKGWTTLVGPSLIFSPDPLVRMTATALFRVQNPELGPAPDWVINFGASFAF
jgi:hypothetical protein